MVLLLPMQGTQENWFDSWVGKIPWSRKWQLIPVFLPRKFHGQRSLEGYGVTKSQVLDTTEHTYRKTIPEAVW